MEGFQLIKQGAEAKLYQGMYLGKNAIAKERFVKKYRHSHLDTALTKERMKAETRAIVRCKAAGIRTPTIYLVDFDRRTIFMEYFIHNVTLKDFIEMALMDQLLEVCYNVGTIIGQMHESNIIHGDLTSSNILLYNKFNNDTFSNIKDLNLVFIDFGLAHMDPSTEDKGVDLYVLERALLSTHKVADIIFSKIIEGYKKSYNKGFKEVLSKFEEVRARGRKRTMVG
ncbi:EKC/KEOPS complex subunit TP53RK [Cylas formicarius]|uniref:EKC/KEOPS complex subunit TP53RK n=1 Tax=Cylas formicarius TaxID=197179 RepID=UPI00295862D1|nr:EKC/KEOPS complex subunit TP53RK [Cylas formicarius]